jgi:hypothetical protein
MFRIARQIHPEAIPRKDNKTGQWEFWVGNQKLKGIIEGDGEELGYGKGGYYAYDGKIYSDMGESIKDITTPDFYDLVSNRRFGRPEVYANTPEGFKYSYSSDLYNNEYLSGIENPYAVSETVDGIPTKVSRYANWTNRVSNPNGSTLIGMYDKSDSYNPKSFALKSDGKYKYGHLESDSNGDVVFIPNDGSSKINLGKYNSKGSIKPFE